MATWRNIKNADSSCGSFDDLLRTVGEDCTCNLAPFGNLSEPTVNHHLKKLENTGLLIKQRPGSSVYDRVVPEVITTIARVLQVGG